MDFCGDKLGADGILMRVVYIQKNIKLKKERKRWLGEAEGVESSTVCLVDRVTYTYTTTGKE
jgi:hypothetical protein